MKVVLLGPGARRLEGPLAGRGEETFHSDDPPSVAWSHVAPGDLLVSYGYRHRIKREELKRLLRPPLNLHISLLPWNRGADPNLWSFLEDTPKGVTIHRIDEGLDTGDILLQQQIVFPRSATLRTSYELLQQAIEELFLDRWEDLKLDRVPATPQPRTGTFHRSRDKVPYEALLHRGHDTPVSDLIGKARRTRPSNEPR